MDNLEYDRKLDELDRMLNDPDSKMEAEKIWLLLAEISRYDSPKVQNGQADIANLS